MQTGLLKISNRFVEISGLRKSSREEILGPLISLLLAGVCQVTKKTPGFVLVDILYYEVVVLHYS